MDIEKEGCYDIAGFVMIYAAANLAPYFVVSQGEPPPVVPVTGSPNKAAEDQINYDQATDTLTIGTVVADPALISEAGDAIIGYWQPDELDGADFDLVGIALRNASKHLAPSFRPVDHYAKQTGSG